MTATRCPSCGAAHTEEEWGATIRQAASLGLEVTWYGVTVGCSDIGFRCPSCGHTFGFELLTDDVIARTASGPVTLGEHEIRRTAA